VKLGFIGLGIMGKPMAKNLLKAGHEVVCYDIVAQNVTDVVVAGAKAAASSKAVAEQCPIVITMLPNSPHVKEAVLGPGGVLEGAKDGTILIDMSSIAPLASQEIKAIDGTLSIMVGGDEEVFHSVKEILLKMGASAVHCGSIGAGNTTKLANQVVVACNIAACAEAFTLAKKAGVDPARVLDAIKGGLAGSTVMNAKVPMMLQGNFKPGFKIDLHIKDLANALDTGHDVGAPLPLTAMLMEMMQTLKADGCGQNDHSALAKYYAKVSGTKIGL
jgi:2-hydroxy-3-oxopropionate reductase